MMWYGSGMSGWGFALMALTNILFWAVVVYGLVVLFRYLNRAPRGLDTQAHSTPEQILADRYARGEIDDEEYRRRLDVLRDSSRGVSSS